MNLWIQNTDGVDIEICSQEFRNMMQEAAQNEDQTMYRDLLDRAEKAVWHKDGDIWTNLLDEGWWLSDEEMQKMKQHLYSNVDANKAMRFLCGKTKANNRWALKKWEQPIIMTSTAGLQRTGYDGKPVIVPPHHFSHNRYITQPILVPYLHLIYPIAEKKLVLNQSTFLVDPLTFGLYQLTENLERQPFQNQILARQRSTEEIGIILYNLGLIKKPSHLQKLLARSPPFKDGETDSRI